MHLSVTHIYMTVTDVQYCNWHLDECNLCLHDSYRCIYISYSLVHKFEPQIVVMSFYTHPIKYIRELLNNQPINFMTISTNTIRSIGLVYTFSWTNNHLEWIWFIDFGHITCIYTSQPKLHILSVKVHKYLAITFSQHILLLYYKKLWPKISIWHMQLTQCGLGGYCTHCNLITRRLRVRILLNYARFIHLYLLATRFVHLCEKNG